MSDFRGVDINQSAQTKPTDQPWLLPSTKEETKKDNSTLTFDDMLLLMVTQMQNQTIDNQMDTNDMMNQLIQMTVMQAITEMSSKVDDMTEANILNYTASLVGQTVTLPVYDKEGKLVGEKEGVVTGTGLYNGQRVIFVGDETYLLNQIMAVGKLPPKPDESEKPDETEPPEGVEPPDETEPPEGDGGEDAASTPPALG